MSQVARACVHFRSYVRRVVQPSAADCLDAIAANRLRLHMAVAQSVVLAHSTDYMVNVLGAMGRKESRSNLVRQFDTTHAISGGRFRNAKFRLVDSISNAFKHVELDGQRHRDTVMRYGPVSCRSLAEREGRTYFRASAYRFDFGRVVLRPLFSVYKHWEFETVEEVEAFIDGRYDIASDGDYDAGDPASAIDRMIEHCDRECCDCGESELDCECDSFVYAGAPGGFNPETDPWFDFDAVMSQISGAYRAN